MAEDAAEALWDFAVRFYRAPDVQRICLALQDEGGADVPLVIFLIFAATRGHVFDAVDLRRIDDAVAPWRQDVVGNLRHARRALRSAPEADARRLREAVKAAELEAERQELSMLSGFMPSTREASAAAMGTLRCVHANLLAYTALLPSLDDGLLAGILAQARLFVRPPAA